MGYAPLAFENVATVFQYFMVLMGILHCKYLFALMQLIYLQKSPKQIYFN